MALCVTSTAESPVLSPTHSLSTQGLCEQLPGRYSYYHFATRGCKHSLQAVEQWHSGASRSSNPQEDIFMVTACWFFNSLSVTSLGLEGI